MTTPLLLGALGALATLLAALTTAVFKYRETLAAVRAGAGQRSVDGLTNLRVAELQDMAAWRAEVLHHNAELEGRVKQLSDDLYRERDTNLRERVRLEEENRRLHARVAELEAAAMRVPALEAVLTQLREDLHSAGGRLERLAGDGHEARPQS